jgi:hypothetical protein
MIKLEHLRHPFRAARYAQKLVMEHHRMRSAVSRGRTHPESNACYELQCVRGGFASRLDEAHDDTLLLERICAAYIKATEQRPSVPDEYGATPWWRNIQRNGLKAVRHALATRDINKLRTMYRNFFRDPCSTGLVTRPPGRAASCFNAEVDERHRRFIFGEALDRVDYWRTQTAGKFPLSDLSGPCIGNPFGVLFDDTLVVAGAEYQHYCANRILELLYTDRPHDDLRAGDRTTVAEIGGGFGGMAYYLLRGKSNLTYLDFDVPESLALTAYYLAKSMTQSKMLLCGESDFTQNATRSYDVILMPPWELTKLPTNSVDVTFSSHALSDLVHAAQAAYLQHVARAARGWLLTVGAKAACDSLRMLIAAHYPSFACVATRLSEWNSYRAPRAEEIEHLFKVRENAG